MEKKIIILLCIIGLLLVGNVLQFAGNYSRLYFNAVPDEKTAMIIAEAVLKATYGEDYFELDSLVLTLDTSFDRFRKVWIVCRVFPEVPEGGLLLGTNPEVTIRMSDGKVMSIKHR